MLIDEALKVLKKASKGKPLFANELKRAIIRHFHTPAELRKIEAVRLAIKPKPKKEPYKGAPLNVWNKKLYLDSLAVEAAKEQEEVQEAKA